jgi:hypothetical protein
LVILADQEDTSSVATREDRDLLARYLLARDLLARDLLARDPLAMDLAPHTVNRPVGRLGCKSFG